LQRADTSENLMGAGENKSRTLNTTADFCWYVRV